MARERLVALAPGGTMGGKMLERTAFDDDYVRAQDSCVHREERNHIEQGAVAGKARKIDVDLGKRLAQVQCRTHVKRIEHLEVHAGMHLPCPLDAVTAH